MWQTPKTTWAPGDCFNIEDYNRIKGNLNVLHEIAMSAWLEFPFVKMGADKTYSDISYYADEIDLFEDNLDAINNGTCGLAIGEKKTYEANKVFIGSEELNRIESACLKLHEYLTGTANGRKTLEFTLNGGDF